MGNALTVEERAFLRETHFTEADAKKLKRMVAHVQRNRRDDDHDHDITFMEFDELFRACLESNQVVLERLDTKQIFLSIDRNGDGRVSFEELVLWLSVYQRGSEVDKLRHLFSAFDLDHSGTLTADELARVLEILKISFQDRGLREGESIVRASGLVNQLRQGESNPNISVEQWIAIGTQTGLVRELLGSPFIEAMDEFKLSANKK